MRGFGELEAVVMDRVWEHGGPVTVRELFDDLRRERPIAYTTVMSTMDNLHRKGWLARDKDGKAYRYTAVASRDEYSARLMREAMAEAGDTEAVLSHFVAAMDGGQAEALRADRSIAYTTVMSTMDNLHRKGWLARERDGKAYRYTAVSSREEYSARLMREAMDGAGDTEAVLSHFVAQMDGAESAALRAVLDKLAGRTA